MIVEIFLSGFLFLFLIILNFVGEILGAPLMQTIIDLDSEAKLRKISDDPKKFRIAIGLALTEHVGIIALAVTLFLAFSQFNIILGSVWAIFRIGEGSIQIYDKRNYWRLHNIAKQYANTSGAKKNALIDVGRTILKRKNSTHISAQILFSIGTLAYSILFVTYGVVPPIIGWAGIIASILYGFGIGLKLVKPNFKILWQFGGLLLLLFEVVLGGWLLLSPFI